MSFSRVAACIKSNKNIKIFPVTKVRVKNIDQNCCNKKIVTLQVRILKKSGYLSLGCCGKKAFPFTSFSGLRQRLPASMTLEAALVLSLFIFASVSLILPMKIMNTERRIQAALEAAGEELSQYAYLQDALGQGKEASVPGADEFARSFCENLGSAAAAGYVRQQVMKQVDTRQVKGVTMLRSSIREEGEALNLVLDYEIQMPFPVLGIGSLKRTARCSRRAWIGLKGKAGDGNGVYGTEGGETVYVGRGSTRYHKDPSCHYLVNHLTGIPFETVAEKRNNSGGKYYACSVCGPGKPGGTVFIMPEGSSYHTETGCRAIVAYAQAVKLETVEHLGACSYCSR